MTPASRASTMKPAGEQGQVNRVTPPQARRLALHPDTVPAPVVADRLAVILRSRVVISDAAAYDRAFLDRLVDLRVDWPDHSLIDLEEAVRWLDEPARVRLRAVLDGDPAPHRAGEDAARLARAWLAACTG